MNSEFKKINRVVSQSLLGVKLSMYIKLRITTRLLIFFFLFFAAASCSTQKLPVMELQIERGGQTVAVVKAEIARAAEERNLGLMYRKELADGKGMLFVFETEETLSFWMKNTFIPLSIAFIASDGGIIDIKDMYPQDLNSVTSSRAAMYALEVPQGWFSRSGVRTGDVVDLGILNYFRK